MHPFDQVVLHTPRLRLRPLVASDASALFTAFSNPVVTRYTGAPWPNIEKAHELIAKDLKALPAGEYIRLGLERKDSDELIGMCNLFQIVPQCRRSELGYGMHQAHWGQGLMHEALAALLRYGFEHINLNRVEADVDPRNTGSVRSLERLGFILEGHLRERWIVGDEICDTSLYGLLRSDWQALENPSTATGNSG